MNAQQSEGTDVSSARREFQQLRESIGREELGQVLDQFEEKVETVKQSAGPVMIRRALGQARLGFRLLQSWWSDNYYVPWKTITAIGAMLLYFINPFDLVPDLIPVVGLLDDATVIYLGFTVVQDELMEFAADRGLDPAEFGIDPDRSVSSRDSSSTSG